jgi:hypothetical protein
MLAVLVYLKLDATSIPFLSAGSLGCFLQLYKVLLFVMAMCLLLVAGRVVTGVTCKFALAVRSGKTFFFSWPDKKNSSPGLLCWRAFIQFCIFYDLISSDI